MTPDAGWEFWIDRGGTFTDIVARTPDGEIVSRKLLSEHPGRYRDAAIQGIHDILAVPAGEPLPTDRIRAVNEILVRELEVLAMQAKIRSQAKDEMNKEFATTYPVLNEELAEGTTEP